MNLLAFANRKQRRLGDVNVTRFHQRSHITEQKRQQQRANVTSIDVGVGHQNDAVVAQTRDVEGRIDFAAFGALSSTRFAAVLFDIGFFDLDLNLVLVGVHLQRALLHRFDVGGQIVVIDALGDASSKSRDHGADFFVAQNLIQTVLFDVDNLAAQRQNRLKTAVATLLCASASRIAFDEKYLALVGVFFAAVGEFARQRIAFQRVFALH